MTGTEGRIRNTCKGGTVTGELAAQGGCEPQLTSHVAVNMRIVNDTADKMEKEA